MLPKTLHRLLHHLEDRHTEQKAPDNIKPKKDQGLLHRGYPSRKAIDRRIDHLEYPGSKHGIVGYKVPDFGQRDLRIFDNDKELLQYAGDCRKCINSLDLRFQKHRVHKRLLVNLLYPCLYSALYNLSLIHI